MVDLDELAFFSGRDPKPGDQVEMSGMVLPKFNGRKGVVTGLPGRSDAGTVLWPIQLEGETETRKLKLENLRLITGRSLGPGDRAKLFDLGAAEWGEDGIICGYSMKAEDETTLWPVRASGGKLIRKMKPKHLRLLNEGELLRRQTTRLFREAQGIGDLNLVEDQEELVRYTDNRWPTALEF